MTAPGWFPTAAVSCSLCGRDVREVTVDGAGRCVHCQWFGRVVVSILEAGAGFAVRSDRSAGLLGFAQGERWRRGERFKGDPFVYEVGWRVAYGGPWCSSDVRDVLEAGRGAA